MNTYIIKKATAPITDESFQNANVATVSFVPWPEYPYPFKTEARLLYDNEAIYVNLKTNEWPLTARHNARNTEVCEDSCMEFFIQPDAEDKNYVNFEINPLGTLLLGYGKDRYERTILPESEEIFAIKSVINQKEWQLFYKIPFSFLLAHFKTISPEFYGNLYKCGEETPHVHYACWNPILDKKLDFHRFEFFGKFVLEEGIAPAK